MSVFVFDEFDPEATAMLQALYSRSSKSVTEHIKKVRLTGSAKFMESFYVGYGHSSIGDCGTTTIFVEDVSIIATKVFQDNPLYSGQESSTRYIDFSKQRMENPLNGKLGDEIQRRWLDFYLSQQEPMISFLRSKFPLEDGQKETVWNKALQARAFDILRGFLPAGVCTQFSWTTNLRQASDNLFRLSAHPLEEVRRLASEIRCELSKKYPSSFSHSVDADQERYLRDFYKANAFLSPKHLTSTFSAESLLRDPVPVDAIAWIIDRPRKATLPRNIANVARYKIECTLDYGSFRDLQRHRNAYCTLPLLSTSLGFSSWYLNQLPDAMRIEANKLISDQEKDLTLLRKDSREEDLQYYIPMGYSIFFRLECDLSEFLYITELRSGRTVHPTLRKLALRMAEFLESQISGIPIYFDRSQDDWDVRRGEQDIVEKRIKNA